MQVLKNGLQGLHDDSAYDLVVIGVGGAGMAAALFAAMEGASVCLLYTSPSPRDYAASRMPSSA